MSLEILRRKLGGNRVIPSPDDRARLLAIGQELDHNVADVIGIVTPQTYRFIPTCWSQRGCFFLIRTEVPFSIESSRESR